MSLYQGEVDFEPLIIKISEENSKIIDKNSKNWKFEYKMSDKGLILMVLPQDLLFIDIPHYLYFFTNNGAQKIPESSQILPPKEVEEQEGQSSSSLLQENDSKSCKTSLKSDTTHPLRIEVGESVSIIHSQGDRNIVALLSEGLVSFLDLCIESIYRKETLNGVKFPKSNFCVLISDEVPCLYWLQSNKTLKEVVFHKKEGRISSSTYYQPSSS